MLPLRQQTPGTETDIYYRRRNGGNISLLNGLGKPIKECDLRQRLTGFRLRQQQAGQPQIKIARAVTGAGLGIRRCPRFQARPRHTDRSEQDMNIATCRQNPTRSCSSAPCDPDTIPDNERRHPLAGCRRSFISRNYSNLRSFLIPSILASSSSFTRSKSATDSNCAFTPK